MAIVIDPETLANAALASMGIADAPASTTAAAHNAAAAAVELVGKYLGTDDDNPIPEPLPAPITEALVIATTEMFKRRDAAFGVLNGWNAADFGPVRISTDWLKSVESLLHPYMRDSFGIG